MMLKVVVPREQTNEGYDDHAANGSTGKCQESQSPLHLRRSFLVRATLARFRHVIVRHLYDFLKISNMVGTERAL
jgi:hypothetical protein